MQKNKVRALACAAFVLLLSACGGGGGGGGSGGFGGFGGLPITPAAQAPTVNLKLSATKVAVGQNVTLSWSSTNAASCTGADAWSGAQASSGETTVTPDAGIASP